MSDEQDSGMILYAEEPIDRPHWNFRIVKNTLDQFFAICIVEHAPDGSVIFVHKPEDSYPTKTDPEDFTKDLRRYVNALNRPVLEVP